MVFFPILNKNQNKVFFTSGINFSEMLTLKMCNRKILKSEQMFVNCFFQFSTNAYTNILKLYRLNRNFSYNIKYLNYLLTVLLKEKGISYFKKSIFKLFVNFEV